MACGSMLGRHSGIGNRIPRFPDFFLPGIGEGIPDSRFGRETRNPRFPIRPGTGIGVPIGRAGDFLVCHPPKFELIIMIYNPPL
jgi:hypothetical protein